MSKKVSGPTVKYTLDKKGAFVIQDYNQSKPFSNFFPGIAGLLGIPMWVFYVNRGQGIASFGIESKDKSIMEFLPANKAYRSTPLHGFRTFIKVKTGRKTTYWEPFQAHLKGTDFKKNVKMSITAHDLTLEEKNEDLGLVIKVNYFTLPNEPFAALVRKVSVKNVGKTKCDIEIIDGLPMIVPFGLTDWILKNMARTVEAWVKVRNMDKKAPYYQLNVEVADTPQVKHIEEGNFYFAFDPNAKGEKLLKPIVEVQEVFGKAHDFIVPEKFLENKFSVSEKQKTDNKTPSAMTYASASIAKGASQEIISLFGYAPEVEQLNELVNKAVKKGYIAEKTQQNKEIINDVMNYALTGSSSKEFNLYSSYTFLDNILRGGLPVSLKASEDNGGENVVFNVFSRKHGDLERDYNYFVVAPTFYSQGNGNFRDVNQNRRNDVWFNDDVRESHLVNFFNLSQADGYNPLVVKGTSFTVEDRENIDKILDENLNKEDKLIVNEVLDKGFLPGELLDVISREKIVLNIPQSEFLGRILEKCQKQELADHGEGFWCDHWTYNLDLIESYLSIYPEDLKRLVIESKAFNFYLNSHYVLPRDQRYILTDVGVRQYESVAEDEESIQSAAKDFKLKTKNGEGSVYQTNLSCKLLCLIANKVATLDPSGIGVEMEADKPGWYDALNGLPGLLGSSICETFEVGRFAQFLLDSFQQLSLADDETIDVFEELATFIDGLTNLLSLEDDAQAYWVKSNDIKEHYRQCVRKGITGDERKISVLEIKNFLSQVVKRTKKSFETAKNADGRLPTYFYHEVSKHQMLDKKGDKGNLYVKPLKFIRHDLPLFLEGYVHALRVCDKKKDAETLYKQVRSSSLFDKETKMYKVNSDLSDETEEIGRTRIFPRSWLENESIWLHMEYKFLLELIKNELYDEYYENFKNILVPFLKPETYGRSILENSSFIVSGAHEDEKLHGRGFVARLSGSTAEFLHMWLVMNAGTKPFILNTKNEVVLNLRPALPAWLFNKKKSEIEFSSEPGGKKKIELPVNTYAFNFLGSTLVVYHNSKRKNTFGPNAAAIKEARLTYRGQKKPVIIKSASIPAGHALDVRDRKVERIDVFLV